jgi:hypothetical protein
MVMDAEDEIFREVESNIVSAHQHSEHGDHDLLAKFEMLERKLNEYYDQSDADAQTLAMINYIEMDIQLCKEKLYFEKTLFANHAGRLLNQLTLGIIRSLKKYSQVDDLIRSFSGLQYEAWVLKTTMYHAFFKDTVPFIEKEED